MKAKRQTRKVGVAGGFFNQMMGNNATEPVVGEGATILHYSDRSAYDVTWVSEDGSECRIRKAKATFVGKSYGDERYTYESDPEAPEILLRWNPKKGKWQKVYKVRRIMKARLKELQDKYGVWSWTDGLLPEYGVTINEITDGSAGYHYRDVPGLTKVYEEKHDVSIIFGVREEYRDPSF